MLNFRHNSKKLLPILAVVLSTQSCIDQNNFDFENLESVNLQPAVALPLLHGSLTMADLLPKEGSSNILIDEDNLIHIIYSDTLATRSIRDYFLLKPLIIEDQYTPIVTGPLLEDGEVVNEPYLLNLDFPEADFDEVRLKAGKIYIATSSTVKADIEVQLHFPTLTKNGEVLTHKLSLPINSTIAPIEIDLSGYILDLTGYGLGENKIPVTITASTSNQQEGIGGISARVEFADMDYSLLTGYFGKLAVDLPHDTIQLEVFDNIFSKGNFDLKDPSLSLDFINSNGAPIQAKIQKFEASKSTGETLPILTDPATEMAIEAPLNPGEETVKTLTVTNEVDVIKFAPSAIVYEFWGEMNPDGRPATPNFLTDKSRAAAVLHADLPLWGYLEGFTLTDTVKMGIELENDQDYIKEGAIKLFVKNQFPIDGHIKVDFVDSNNTVIETLFDTDVYENLLPGSKVDADGNVLEEGVYDKEITLTSERFEKILSAAKIIVRANLATSKSPDGTFPYVKIKADQALSINMGVKAAANNLVIKLDE